MDNFPKIEATAMSLGNRKPVYSVGINDSRFQVYSRINGKRVRYKPYTVWMSMLKRCYSSKHQEKYPTYVDCEVCEEWLIFSNFEKWMLTQNFDGLALDKDIIKQGNKVYCPKYCRFVSTALNNLLIGCDAARGNYPLGVSWDKEKEKYQATMAINGKHKHLGTFKTVEEAKAAYDKAKYAEIKRHALMQTDPLIRAGLLKWVVE